MSYLGIDPNGGDGLSSILSGSVNRYSYTATGGQTTFDAVYSPGYVDVYLNGIRLDTADYTATNGTTVVLAVAADTGDLINIVGQEAYPATDTYSQANIDAALATKQNTLVSGTNIKTVGGNQLLGSGDVQVQAPLVSGTNIKTLNGTQLLGSGDFVLASTPTVLQRTITGADTLIAADQGKLINAAGTFTLAMTAAASLGNGWWCYVRNTGTGTITLDPNGSETVDGVTSGPVHDTILLVCDGVGFTSMKVGPFGSMQVLTSGTSWTCPISIRKIKVTVIGGGGGATTDGPGAAGGNVISYLSTSPGTSYSYAVGAGGTASNYGGTSSFSTLSAGGGYPGGATNAQGGSASGGQLNINGMPSPGFITSYGLSAGSLFGFGGRPGVGNAPTGYGSGGSYNNGAGTPGVVILEY